MTRLRSHGLKGVLALATIAVQTLTTFSGTSYAADAIPPSIVNDLGTTQPNSTSIQLSWTAPGNDGTVGTATSYEIRYYKGGPVTDQTWNVATQVSGVPSPASSGSQQTFTVSGLSANTRYWFGIKASDGTNWSGISNSPANLVTDMSQVNVWAFDQAVNNSRDRALTRIIQPDIIHRGIYEWVGTELQDKNFDGITATVQRLTKDGSILSGGVSAHWWAPRYETLAPGVNVNEAGYNATDDYTYIDPNTVSGKAQLEYKAKKQIDLGAMGIEFDEMYNQNNAASILQDVRNYAWNTYGKKIFVMANNYWGGAGVSDYNINDYPMSTTNGRFDAGVNNISWLKGHVTSSNVPVMWFQDHAGSFTTGPSNAADYAAFLRSGNAQGLAAGGFPGQLKSWMNSYDTYQNGVFSLQAGHFKFMRENSELFHNLTQLSPSTLTSSANKVYMSALGQTGRTVLHLVNGNFNPSTQVMTTQTNFTAKVSLSTAPTRIWMTTPDKLWNSRRTIPAYTYSGGVATISIPELQWDDILVIEQGTTYDPVYSALKVILPFPNPQKIAAGNSFRFNAAQNDGWSSTFNWYVNGVLWGNSSVGTIDGNGFYIAPTSIPSGGKVTIKAVSKDDATASDQVDVSIVGASGIPWTETFASDTVGNLPESWQVVDGNGDWKVDTDGGTKVLHNYNMSEGRVEQFQTGAGGNLTGALHEPMITGGNNTWTNYTYSASVKPTKKPYTWYGINSEKIDTYAGLVFRFKDRWNYYVYRWAEDGYVRLYKMVNGVESKVGGDVSAPFPGVGSYTNLMVDVNGSSFTAYENGVALRTDTDTSVANGSVGVLSNMMDNDFKDISVKAQGSVSAALVSGATYVISSKSSGKVIEVAALSATDGAIVDQWTSNGGNNQKWRLDDMGGGSFKLTNVNSGKVLDVVGFSTTAGAGIDQWTDNGGINQRFTLTSSGGGYYKIVAQTSGLPLDINGGSTSDGANIIQWTDTGGDNQRWVLAKQ
ncbi:hypothetical protein A8709_28555 [Paenibacillus pectinilyticus]|uniref:Fibronectin type-III domain-containing protein n=1 Tax=Paenibacillus pectinilyticus TaxID=512399 RepID=A0A1C0ZUP3_9BACL|nr:RICIN domain-containing protein [Paenibacillus pectinilyticus]OCT11821.1 hypothetical protein A8709_28555 [Paenibacillus pectinilyticus]